MRMKKIRFLLVTLVALLAGVSSVAAKTVYIQPNDWAKDGAVISLWVWGDGIDGSWATLSVVEEGIYKAALDDGITTMHVVRGSVGNSWADGEKWNESGDIPATDGKLVVMGDIAAGTYTTQDYTEPVAAGYKVDFNTVIATSNHDFSVASNWGHVVDYLEYDDYGTEYAYVNYTHSSNGGVDGTGALGAYSQNLSGGGDSKTAYDLLVTPLIQGTVTIDVKAMNYSDASLEVYALESDGKTKSTLIKSVSYSDLSTTDYTTISFELATEQKVGLRLNRVYIDNFAASSATILAEPKLSITNVKKATDASNVYFEQQADGSLLVQLYVTLKNDGEVDFEAGVTENYTLSVLQDYYGTKTGPFGAFDIPVNLAKGETSDPILLEIHVPAESVSSLKTWGNWYVIENVTSSQSTGYVWASWTAYEPKFIFREAGSTATSSISAAEAWGTIMTETTKSFEIANTGTAPLTIKSVTLPDGFTSDNAPAGAEVILAKGETLALNITNDASKQGTFTGDLKIVYLDKDNAEQTYTLAFSVTVIGANTWTANFNNSTSTVVYPAGSVAEGGINRDYNYISSGNYNNWLVGRNDNSYKTENNKFITPKLHANAGDQLAFDVKAGYSGSNDYFVKVYVSTDRKTWGEPVAYYTYTTDATKGSEGIGSAFTTKTVTFDTAGDYYVAFALYGSSGIDNLVGLEKVDVAHDLFIKSVSWPDASIKSGSNQSKPSVTFIPLTTETAENYTVKYLCGSTVLGEGTSKALTASATSSTDIAVNWTPNVTETTVYPETKVVIEFTDGTKFETETFDLTVTNEAIFHFLKTLPSSKWYEPSDYTTPIAFGKTNTADTQSFYLYNWGSAPLTVNSITLPEGFSTTTTFPVTIAAMDENYLSASAQALDITFSATAAGTYSGDMVITHSGDQTFTLGISGTRLDPTKFYATFGTSSDASNYPAGSLAQANISIATPLTDNGALSSSSSTKNLFITPLLTSVGETMLFDARQRSSYYTGSVKVYSVSDHIAAANTTNDEEFAALNPTLLGEFSMSSTNFATYSFEVPAGDSYLAFKVQDAYVDEIYGLAVADVAHELQIASSNIPTEGMQNNSLTASVNVLNLGLNDDVVTVTAYVDGEAMATGAAVNIPMNHKLTDAGTQASVSFIYPKVGTYPVYLEVKAGDYSVVTDPVNVTFADEQPQTTAGVGGTTTSSYGPVYMGDKNCETVSLYTAQVLQAGGLKPGDKIKSIAFKGYNTSDETTSKFEVWYEWTDDQTLAKPTGELCTAEYVQNMTKIADEDSRAWPKVGSSSNYVNLIEFDFSGSPLVYQQGKSLRIVVRNQSQAYKGKNFVTTGYTDLYYRHHSDYSSYTSATWNTSTLPAIYFELAPANATLAGTVTTSAGASIANATITLKADNGVQYSTTTNDAGQYTLDVIQAGLDFTATVEAAGYLKNQFAYNLEGTSKTLDVTMYKTFGIVGTLPGFSGSFDSGDIEMTQSTENPNIFILEMNNVYVPAGSYEYKLRADEKWGTYQLPADNSNFNWNFSISGYYNYKFTFDWTNHTLTFERPYTLAEDANGVDALNWVDVTIEREFKAGWNAVVLPFNLTKKEVINAFGANSEVAECQGDNGTDNVTVYFMKRDVTDVDDIMIEAGTPYLIWLKNPVSGLKFTKNIVTDTSYTPGQNFDFVGVYTTTPTQDGDYFVKNGEFQKCNTTNTVKPFRSYLKYKGTSPVRSLNFVVDDETITTEIDGLEIDTPVKVEGAYNLNGQKVENLKKGGLYIINGKKVIWK